MRARDIRPVADHICKSMDGFAVNKNIVYKKPLRDILRGLYFESSSYSKDDFYIWVFAQPMFIPEQYLAFSFGRRIERAHVGWRLDQPDLKEAVLSATREHALPFIHGTESVERLPGWLQEMNQPDDPYWQQAMAYSLAAAGRINEADRSLGQLASMLDPAISWQGEMKQRAEYLQKVLGENPDALKTIFADWKTATKKSLGFAGID